MREHPAELVKSLTELAVYQIQHAVLLSNESGHRRLEPRRPGTGEDRDFTLRAEQVLGERADVREDLLEFRTSVVHRGPRHRLEDARIHLDGARKQEHVRGRVRHRTARTSEHAINDSFGRSKTKKR